MNRKDPQFRLMAYLKADLQRQHAFSYGHDVSAPGSWVTLLSPRFVPVFLCRVAYWFYCLHIGSLARAVSLLNFFLFGIEIDVCCPIGKGLFLPHTQGTVIGAWSIGENATIFQGVTLGASKFDPSCQKTTRPVLGDGVLVGAGAKILGGIVIGNGVKIGANAVVLHSLPPDVVAVGIPAKIIKRPLGTA